MTATTFKANPSPTSIPAPGIVPNQDHPLVPSIVFCPTCRRLQPPARAGCASCGAAASGLRDFGGHLAALPGGHASHAVRYPGDTRFVVQASLSFAALFSLALLVSGEQASTLALVALVTGIGAAALVDARRAACVLHSVRHVPPPPAAVLATAARDDCAVAGTAQPLDRFVAAPLARHDCLAVRLDIRAGVRGARGARGAEGADPGSGQPAGDLLAQWLDTAEFMVTTARGARTLVTGVIYLDAGEYDVTEPSEHIDIALHGQPVTPSSLGGDGWACELALAPGDRVEIQGRSTGEVGTAPAGALYRDAGALAVIRGVPGDPVIVRVRRR